MLGAMSQPSPPPAGPDPWRTRASRQVYDNAWINVREDQVIRPDGSDGIYGVVSFKNLAVGAVVRHDDGDTVLVGQHRYPLGRWSWEIPEGGADPAADPLAEAQRELREETGLLARRWTALGALHTSNSATDEAGQLWLAEDLTQHDPAPDATEQLRLWRLPLLRAHELAMDGTLTDSLTIIGLCRATHHLHTRERRRADPALHQGAGRGTP